MGARLPRSAETDARTLKFYANCKLSFEPSIEIQRSL